ncbi:MAG: hypothetical protein MK135_10900, partial [Polyangiaceae bacterium]|nr:hypothetical protein [Polyangiaceae bacterium]
MSRPIFAVGLVVALGAAAEIIPGAEYFRIFSPPAPASGESPSEPAPDAAPDLSEGETELKQSSVSRQAMATPEEGASVQRARGPIGGHEALEKIEDEAPPVPLLDPTGKSLDNFFQALASTQRKEKGAITRIAHFGDSIVVSDYVSGTLRRNFQKQFGDAGHGYMLVANAWPAYFHNDVFRFATAGFRVSRIVGPTTKDGFYGLGGVTFRAYSGVRATYGTAEKGKFGRNVSHFTLSYLARPHGGQFEVLIDGKKQERIDTRADQKQVVRKKFSMIDGEHKLELVVKKGESRFFGIVLERDEPGVVYDALGVQGARIRFLDKQEDEHFAEELKWRNPNLLVFQFGANESGDGYAYS